VINSVHRVKGWSGWRVLVIALLCAPASGLAAETLRPGAVNSTLERFIDGVMTRAVVTGESVGATVAVVQDGRLIVARGYGRARIDGEVPVEARVTQFRIGSISKVFVWMSVLQLVEAGKLDLDTDINTYLKRFQIPSAYGAPITLRHLMTHTAGFEDQLTNLFAEGPRAVGDLGATLAQRLPTRVRRPGTLVAYSNYGAALAGHIVSEVSGEPFERYVEDNLFAPMSMQSATMRQPVPEAIERTRARGYTQGDGELVEEGFTYIPFGPAGAGTATALDIAKMMVELLNPAGTSVLSARSKAQLLSGAYVVHPEVNSMTLGLYETSVGDVRSVGHDGDTILFSSKMTLWPEEKLGVFVSSSGPGGDKSVRELMSTMAAHLGFDRRAGELSAVANASALVGSYWSARRNSTGHTKILNLFIPGLINVSHQSGADYLWIQDLSGGHRFKQVTNDVFQEVGGENRVVFVRGDDGRVEAMYHSGRATTAFTPTLPGESINLVLLIVGGWLLLSVTLIITWPIASLANRGVSRAKGQGMAALVMWASIALMLVFVAQIAGLGSGVYDFVVSGLPQLGALMWYPLMFVGLVVLQLYFVYRVWMYGFWWPTRRWHYTLFAIAQCALVWFFAYWNILPEPVLRLLQSTA